MQCMELIFQAKDKQAQEANRVANNLLKEIECEKTKEQNKKAAAQRKREKRKQKKKQQTKEEKQQDANDLTAAKKGAETKKSDNKKLEADKKISTTRKLHSYFDLTILRKKCLRSTNYSPYPCL